MAHPRAAGELDRRRDGGARRPRGRAARACHGHPTPRTRSRRGDPRARGAPPGALRATLRPAARRLPPPRRRGARVRRGPGPRRPPGSRPLVVPARAERPRLLLPGGRGARHALRPAAGADRRRARHGDARAGARADHLSVRRGARGAADRPPGRRGAGAGAHPDDATAGGPGGVGDPAAPAAGIASIPRPARSRRSGSRSTTSSEASRPRCRRGPSSWRRAAASA